MNVLLVEDSDGDARLFEVMLDDASPGEFAVTRADTLESSKSVISRTCFDAVILDLTLPDSRGIDTLRTLASENPSVPIVILTGAEDERAARYAAKCGAQDYIVKGRSDGHLIARSIFYAIERKRTEERLYALAYFDSLTELPNRKLFVDRLDHSIAVARRTWNRLSLLFIDLDRFKAVNDTLGHAAGDELLRLVAGRLKRCVRESDTVARLAGDEFTVILEGVDSAGKQELVARKIIESLDEPFEIAGRSIHVSPSIGIASYPECGTDSATLIRNADAAMLDAKSKGRNRFRFFRPDIGSEMESRMRIEDGLRKAIGRGELRLHYQPVIALGDGRITGVEALMRWDGATHGSISPAKFIPLAEETGLIVPMGEWALREACSQAKQWIELGVPADFTVAVNVSAMQLKHDKFLDTLNGVLADTGLDPARLSLEITERTLLPANNTCLDVLARARRMGVRVAVDDFGIEYSSLNYLKRFPVDILKIDRSFIEGVCEDRMTAAIAKTILHLGEIAGLKVVAEGIETPGQFGFLREAGCGYGQGFLFAKPGPASAVRELFGSCLYPKAG